MKGCGVVKQRRTKTDVIVLERKHMTTRKKVLIYIFGMAVLKTKNKLKRGLPARVCQLTSWICEVGKFSLKSCRNLFQLN